MHFFVIKLLSIILVVLGLLLPRFAIADMVFSDLSGPLTIPEEYFGMHVRWGATTHYWPKARFHSWRIITTETTWHSLEQQKGVWHFGALDKAVATAEARGVEALYTLGYAPQWAIDPKFTDIWNPGLALPPQDLRDWETYVQAVVKRYKGRIKYYELMNEPHFTEVDGRYSKRDFPVAAMVEMARIASRILKQHDPEARLVSMSPSGAYNGIRRVNAFLEAGGGNYIDIVGFHFYEQTPEAIPKLVDALRKVLSNNGLAHLPIWNTESGFHIAAPGISPGKIPASETLYSQTQGGAMVSRSLILGAAAGLRRFYWYSWDIPSMALTDGKGRTITPAGHAYIKTERWLRGATISECRTADGKLWICTLNRGVRQARLVWNTTGTRDWVVPAKWRAQQYETLLGNEVDVAQNRRIQLDEAPLLIVSDSQSWGTP